MVWRRRLGTFFEHDPKTNPKDWGREADDERRAITEWCIPRLLVMDTLQLSFGRSAGLRPGAFVSWI